MTSVPPVSIPASGVSARPSLVHGEGKGARAIDPVKAAQERRPDGETRERRALAQPDGRASQASIALSASFLPPPAEASGAGRSPLERASEAYRKAGAEPTRYTEEPRLFSLRA